MTLKGFAKRHAEATHCSQGHEWTPENIRRGTDHGERICKICASKRTAAWINKQDKHYRRNKPIFAFARWLAEQKRFNIPQHLIDEYIKR